MQKIITVKPDGTTLFIYDDRLRGLLAKGKAEVKRASHVDADADLTWHADMSPVGGPMLKGFPTRQAALDVEVAWINQNVLTESPCQPA
ncbi:MAG: hypothetical protein WCI73_07375 [Phycisphaerae bacterium]